MKILLVDDNRAFLDVMGTLLQDNGHEILIAEDGKQARECLEYESVDLIMSDVFMPTLDGTRFHSYVREFMDSKDIPFIFISGYDDETTRRLVADSNKDFFLSKTVPLEEVLSLVERVKKGRKANSPASN